MIFFKQTGETTTKEKPKKIYKHVLKLLGTETSLLQNLENFFSALSYSNSQTEKLKQILVTLHLPEDSYLNDFPWLQNAINTAQTAPFSFTAAPSSSNVSAAKIQNSTPFPMLYFVLKDVTITLYMADINKIPQSQQAFLEALPPWGSAFLNCILL
ncbi:MAG: hypothetical protein MJ179_03385 [Treponema sp.]|nr:hypothetical protein [Treponema sp.]